MASLSPARWAQIDALLAEGLELAETERTAWLDQVQDLEVRHTVERLLVADADTSEILDAEAADYAAPLLPPEEAGQSIGTRIGAYRIDREIARGGMGRVVMASRADGAFEQQVALKLLRLDTDDARRRFRAERQILASLRHPNIARLLDGGVTEDGQPFLAMEIIEGEPIDVYCDARQLSVDDRLRLFLPVVDAVHHAHRQLVVHRDLKPSNIVVTPDGTPMLLDFGIAKLLDDPNAAETQTGQYWMTPAYAAPEQIRRQPVTTATDVYQLGGVLYEMLTGHRPFEDRSRTVELAALDQDPDRPSASVTRVTERTTLQGTVQIGPERVSKARSTQPDRLRRQLEGDLDTIVLKALRPDPDARYASAEALADDITRHLEGLPVRARTPTVGYRVRRFVRRHRVGVIASALVVLSLVGGLGAAVWQARRAEAAANHAADRAAEAEAVTTFLVDMIGDARPRGSDGDSLRVRDVLDAGVARLDTGFVDQPQVRAALASAFGAAHHKLGDVDAALPLRRLAVDLRRRTLPRSAPEVIAAENELVVDLLNTRQLDELDTLLTNMLAARRADLGPTHIQVAQTLHNLALTAKRRPDSLKKARAEGYFREAISTLERAGPEVYAQTTEITTSYDGFRAGLYYDLAAYYLETDRDSLAAEPMRLSVELSDDPLESTNQQILMNGYGVLLRQLGRHDEAIAVHRDVVTAARATHGPDHPFYGWPTLSLGSALEESGNPEAIPVLREALRVFGGVDSRSQGSLEAQFYLGRALVKAGQTEEGQEVLQRAIPRFEAVFGSDNAYTTIARRLLAEGA